MKLTSNTSSSLSSYMSEKEFSFAKFKTVKNEDFVNCYTSSESNNS